MAYSYKSWLSLLLIAGTLFSCTDHRLGGALSPARFRLKSFSEDNTTTTYTYDAQNQPSTVTRNGVVSTVMYGDPQRMYAKTDTGANHIFYITPSSSGPETGNVIIFPPVLNATDFTAAQRTYAQNVGGIQYASNFLIRQYTYTFNAASQLVRYVSRADAPDINTNDYSYTGNNIMTERAVLAAGRGGIYTTAYTYDDKINPFYGLLDPNVNPRLRATRNNPTASQTRFGESSTTGSVSNTQTYTYEYNAQNLPTKRTVTQTNGIPTTVTTFTYEAY